MESKRERTGHSPNGLLVDRKDELVTGAYAEMKRRARRELRRWPRNGFQTTALAHEAYLKLARQPGGRLLGEGSRAYLRIYAKVLHELVIDAFRSGRRHTGSLDEAESPAKTPSLEELIDLREGLAVLEERHPRAAEVLRLSYFLDRTIEGIASVLQISEATVERDLRFARSWLHRRATGGSGT